MSKLTGKMMRSKFLKFSNRTTLEVLNELTNNQELIKVLTGQYGDYGLPPSQSSFAMHASLVRHYFSGGYFPVGGSSQIVETILPVLEKAGSTILVSAAVEEIIIENNQAKGVRMSDGKEFRADIVISGAGFMTTYKKLLPKKVFEKNKLKKNISKIRNSVAHACLYIGLNGDPKDITHDEAISKYLKNIDEEFPLVYISFPAAKDPDWTNRYPGKSTIDIITLMPWETFAKWENEKWMKRGEEYESLKEKISQRLLEHLFKLEPQLRGKIDYYELSTPITTKHFVNYEKGELYGLDHSPDRFQNKFLRPHTPIKNLFMTGQDIVTAGIGGALFSGVLTSSAILKKNLLKKVMKE